MSKATYRNIYTGNTRVSRGNRHNTTTCCVTVLALIHGKMGVSTLLRLGWLTEYVATLHHEPDLAINKHNLTTSRTSYDCT